MSSEVSMGKRVAVVTGAASGIGLASAKQLAAAGHAIALLDRDGAGAKKGAASLTAEGARAVGYGVDVADRAALERAFESLRSELGPVGILVTSAGVESFDKLLEITPEKWDRILAVNLTGTFTCAQLAARDMMEASWGRIVTISSSSAQAGAAMMAHYVASKGGVIALTRALARDLAPHKITVNTIPPTIVDTPMARKAEADGTLPFGSLDNLTPRVPLGRLGTPQDIAAATAFLCSEEAGYITGQIIGVNGGMQI
ncbi:MAG: SDR family NAD(P)-dependent oxidoreductase [Myxococcales bacterium]|nr:SDR family NAD(P)-dependent oxidoreductase [Myxococcales bacterium]